MRTWGGGVYTIKKEAYCEGSNYESFVKRRNQRVKEKCTTRATDRLNY